MLLQECTYLTKKCSRLQKLKPSKRNELEITDLLKYYLKRNKLNFEILEEGIVGLMLVHLTLFSLHHNL